MKSRGSAKKFAEAWLQYSEHTLIVIKNENSQAPLNLPITSIPVKDRNVQSSFIHFIFTKFCQTYTITHCTIFHIFNLHCRVAVSIWYTVSEPPLDVGGAKGLSKLVKVFYLWKAKAKQYWYW